MSATLLDLDDVLTSDRLENSTTVANEKKQMVIGVDGGSSQPLVVKGGELNEKCFVGREEEPSSLATEGMTIITPLEGTSTGGKVAGEGCIGPGSQETGSGQSQSLTSSSQLHISLRSIPLSPGTTSLAVSSEDKSVELDRARIWKILDDASQTVTFYLGGLHDTGFAVEGLHALNRMKDRALADGRDEQDRLEFWNDYKIVYERLSALPDKERTWQGVLQLNRIHEVFSCGINATDGGIIGKRQMEELMATALQQQEMRFYDQQQSLVATQRQLIVGDIVEEMRKMRRDDRAKLAHHIDMRVDDLERRLVSKLQRLPATGMYTAEDTLDFQHPTETKGQLPQSRPVTRGSAIPSRSSRSSSSQASQSLNEVTSDPQLSGLPATGIEGIRAEVCRNFRKIAAHELSVGIRDIVHVLSPEVDTQGWVRVRLQGDRGGTGFVPASVLKVVE